MEQALEAELRGPGAGRAGLRRGHPGDQLLAPALRSRRLGRDRAAVGGVPRPRRGGVRPGRRRGGPAAGRAPGGVRPRGRRLPRHHGPRGRGGRRRVDRGGGAPLPRRPDRPRHPAVRGSRRSGTTFATAGSRSRSTSPATCRPGRWRGPSEHPVRAYFDAGLAVTLCTDGWLMTGVSLTDEYWLAHTELGFTREEIDRMILDGFESAFLPWPERQALVRAGARRAGGARTVTARESRVASSRCIRSRAHPTSRGVSMRCGIARWPEVCARPSRRRVVAGASPSRG